MKDTRILAKQSLSVCFMYPIHCYPRVTTNTAACVFLPSISTMYKNRYRLQTLQNGLRGTKAVFTALISKEGTYNHQTISAVKNNI